MPTIDELAPATAASDTDELIASQNGIARKVTRAQVLSGVQPQISLSSGTLLGRQSAGSGAPEQIGIGSNLTLSGGTLAATASPFTILGLPAGNVPSTIDQVAIGQSGSNVALSYAQFMNGLSSVPNVDASQLVVTPTGSTQPQKLADYAAGMLPITGGTLAGPLTLAGDPTTQLQAATKGYVDAQSSANLPKSGGTLTGALTLASNPTAALQAVPKQYVDAQAATALPLTGGAVSGAISLPGNPTSALQAAPKQYVDTAVAGAVPLSGGVMTGPLMLPTAPTTGLQAATKSYVDAQVANALPLSGGSLTGSLTLPSTPTTALQAATKSYVDNQVATALPLAGGVVTGAITLPGNPTSVLQATPKQYVDNAVAGALPLKGGALTGPLSLTQSYTGSAVPTMMTAIRAQSVPGDAPLSSATLTVAMSGGANGSNTNALLTTNVNSVTDSNGNAIDGTGAEVYSLVSYLNSNALRPLGVSAVAAQHVSIQSAPTRSLPPGGVPSGRQMAELWALWLPTVDQTNLPSSIANAISANESDLEANNVDDANRRYGIQLIANEAIPLASGGYPLEWAYGILTSTSSTGQFKWIANLQGNYSIAVIDTRNAFPNGTASTPPKITTSLTAPSTTIHVSNVMPFTSAGVYGLPVSSTNTSQIKIGSTTYTQTGYALDGPGLTSGTLTLSSAVSVANGTAGTVVTNCSRTIWMATGQQIAFDYNGTYNIFYDTSVNSLHATSQILADGGFLLNYGSGTGLYWSSSANAAQLQGNLTVTGNVLVNNNVTVGGISFMAGPVTMINTATFNNVATFQSSVTMNNGLTVASGAVTAKAGLTVSGSPINLPTYTVAALPTAAVGALAYASNGRKVGEAAGCGTGVLVVGGSSGWISVMSGTAVTA